MGIPKFGVLTDVVLYKMYMETVSGETSWFEYGDVAKLFDGKVSKGFIAKCIDSLVNKELVETGLSGDSIKGQGILYVEQRMEDQDSVFFNYNKYGDAWLDKQSVGAREGGEPANLSDAQTEEDEWEPLAIDRTAPEYEKAVETLDDAIEKIETDNGYAASRPEERDNVVWSLKEGITAIKEMAPSLAQVRALIMAPLNSAIKTLKESVPGLAAMVAREAIKEWIKSLFS